VVKWLQKTLPQELDNALASGFGHIEAITEAFGKRATPVLNPKLFPRSRPCSTCAYIA